jgi:hypothetical protein
LLAESPPIILGRPATENAIPLCLITALGKRCSVEFKDKPPVNRLSFTD